MGNEHSLRWRWLRWMDRICPLTALLVLLMED